MISLHQYQILSSCADGPELFYFLFAEVNFGGQLFTRSQGDNYAQYVEDAEWPVVVPAEEVVREMIPLINDGFIECELITAERPSGVHLCKVSIVSFSAYNGYSCKTYPKHMERFGYGPHEFYITERGRNEIFKPEYDEYAKILGSTV